MTHLTGGKNVSARMARAQMARNASNMGRLLFGAATGQTIPDWGCPINLIKGDNCAELAAKLHNPLRHNWRNGLATLVVRNVALGDADPSGECALSQAKHLSDGADIVHAPILAPLFI